MSLRGIGGGSWRLWGRGGEGREGKGRALYIGRSILVID